MSSRTALWPRIPLPEVVRVEHVSEQDVVGDFVVLLDVGVALLLQLLLPALLVTADLPQLLVGEVVFGEPDVDRHLRRIHLILSRLFRTSAALAIKLRQNKELNQSTSAHRTGQSPPSANDYWHTLGTNAMPPSRRMMLYSIPPVLLYEGLVTPLDLAPNIVGIPISIFIEDVSIRNR